MRKPADARGNRIHDRRDRPPIDCRGEDPPRHSGRVGSPSPRPRCRAPCRQTSSRHRRATRWVRPAPGDFRISPTSCRIAGGNYRSGEPPSWPACRTRRSDLGTSRPPLLRCVLVLAHSPRLTTDQIGDPVVTRTAITELNVDIRALRFLRHIPASIGCGSMRPSRPGAAALNRKAAFARCVDGSAGTEMDEARCAAIRENRCLDPEDADAIDPQVRAIRPPHR